MDAPAEPKFTPTEQRLLAVLGDGMKHTRNEMLAALDEMADRKALSQRVFHLRRKLRLVGHDIAVEFGPNSSIVTFRRVRLYTPEDRQ